MGYLGRTPSAVPVTADDIPANSIDASKIIDGSIELAEIADNSITDAKLNSSKLDGIETGATNYIHPTTHATADIADNAITEAKIADAAVVSLKSGRKNLIINGGFDVWQRGTSFTNPAANDYMADRYFSGGNRANTTITKNTGVSVNGKVVNTLRIDATGADTLDFYQGIEDYQTISGQEVTISFWYKTNLSGVVCRHYSTGTYGSPLNSDSTWNKFEVTVTLPTLVSAGAGANKTSFGWWAASGGVSAGSFLEIANFQLELGSVATDFEHRSYGEELALCQRYYQQVERTRGSGNRDAGTNVCAFSHALKVEMRTTPTMSFIVQGSDYNYTNNVFQNVTSTSVAALINITTADAYWYYNHGYKADAEL